jgi:hypothetical protein
MQSTNVHATGFSRINAHLQLDNRHTELIHNSTKAGGSGRKMTAAA